MKKLIAQMMIVLSGLLLFSSTGATPPQNGWWWNPNESGRGFALEVQNGTLFIAGFMYDNTGNPVWYTSGPAPMNSDTQYIGKWLSYGGGQTLNGTYKPATLTNGAVGSVMINFSSPTAGVMQMPNGSLIPIVRFPFGPPTPTDGGGNVAATCSNSNLTTSNYNAITPGMTIAQVNQTMGCAFNPSFTQRNSLFIAHIWIVTGTMKYITVYFDLADNVVTPLVTGSYKTATGF